MNIHFIGIGGISMSALAEICINKKYNVSGSDMHGSELTEKLASQGAKIFIGYSGSAPDNSPKLQGETETALLF